MFAREGDIVVSVRESCNLFDPGCGKVALSWGRCVYIFGGYLEVRVTSVINKLGMQ